MKKMLIGVAAAFAVALTSGCASSQPTTSTAALQQKVLAAEVAYEAPLALALAYNALPRCTSPKTVQLCSDPGAVAQIRKANKAIVTAFGAATSLAATPGVTDSAVTAAIAAATDLIGPLQSILNLYK